MLSLILALISLSAVSEMVTIDYIYDNQTKPYKLLEIDSDRYKKLNQTLNQFLKSACVTNTEECANSSELPAYREDFLKPDQLFISLRNPANRLFYYTKLLPLLFPEKTSDPMAAAYFSKAFQGHVEACEDIVQEVGRKHFKDWVIAVSDVRKYLPLLARLGQNLVRLYDHTHFTPLFLSNTHELTYLYPVYAVSSEERDSTSIISTAFSDWMNDLNITSPRYVRLPVETEAETKESGVSLSLEQRKSTPNISRDITEQLIYVIHRSVFRDWHRYPLPVFVGHIEPEIADVYASSGGFFDYDILGGQFVHGYFSHVLQLAQLKQHNFPQQALPHFNHRCWGRMFEKKNATLWHSAARFTLSEEQSIVFYNPVLGSSPDTLQELLSQHFFSDMINSAIAESNPDLINYLFSLLNVSSIKELVQIKNALIAIENSINQHNYNSWHQASDSLRATQAGNEFINENKLYIDEKKLVSNFNNKMMLAPRDSFLEELDLSKYEILYLNPSNTSFIYQLWHWPKEWDTVEFK
ncbi:hypothetical protein [Endozoicomonas numazuensis]|uniref:hypothetical protein n=1 Tax=Endozoicomonas numazuensis TaxID=1137799 RepID=UPI00126816E4|nr:hypothetical protein [Endozoicomonas numazuensis]